jgi:hypothetical protein
MRVGGDAAATSACQIADRGAGGNEPGSDAAAAPSPSRAPARLFEQRLGFVDECVGHDVILDERHRPSLPQTPDDRGEFVTRHIPTHDAIIASTILETSP